MGLACLFYFDKIILGDLALIQWWDVFSYYFPLYNDYGELLLKHGLFYWYPRFDPGLPSFAGQISPLSPLPLISQIISMLC